MSFKVNGKVEILGRSKWLEKSKPSGILCLMSPKSSWIFTPIDIEVFQCREWEGRATVLTRNRKLPFRVNTEDD